MSKIRNEIHAAAKELKESRNCLRAKKLLIGFDGYIDEIIHVVDTKKSKDKYTRIKTIQAFGKRVLSAAGKSANIELVPLMEKLGGNGPIMCMAVAGMGPHITCIGLLGYPDISKVFKPLAEKCRVISIGEPGTTQALEFSDGKLMLGKQNTIPQMCWTGIKKIFGEKEFADLLGSSDIIAATNWTNLTEMDEILENIIRLIPKKNNMRFFFDIADPEKRNVQEIKRVLRQIKKIDKKSSCILGLNLREAEQIASVLGIGGTVEDGLGGLKKAVMDIREKTGIKGVTVHSVKFAAASFNGETESVKGPYCPEPKITTGAGDHFNGGFCTGVLAGMSLKNSLYLGTATSGWYVRNSGTSPALKDVSSLLKTWGEGKLA